MVNVFETEAALCEAFISSVPKEWVVYPETAGWDILLVHKVGGWQIGVEAKKVLNTKVLEQAIRYQNNQPSGPDFRAVLVGRIVAETGVIAHALGLTVIAPKRVNSGGGFSPDLPTARKLDQIGSWWSRWDREVWFDRFPSKRCALPEYIPEVAAGVPSPVILSDWKIKAIRVCIWVERNGEITRNIFRGLGIDPSRWMNGHWLRPGDRRGVWVAGKGFPAEKIRGEHPAIYQKIEADYAAWSAKVLEAR